MVSYIRKFKGCEEQPTYSEYNRIDIKGDVSQWDSVPAGFIAYQNNTGDRDAKGYGSYYYTDNSGRNDIVLAQVAKDSENIYFMVKCADAVTPYTDKNWMNLYIDCSDGWGWESFDYVIGKKPAAANCVYLQSFTGNGYETADVCELQYTVSGDTLVIAVPKASIGISGEEYKIDFKWTDNVQAEDGSGEFKGEILDFYRTGDCAPGGRFKYAFISKTPENPTDTEITRPVTTDGTTTGEETTVNTKNYTPVIIALAVGAVLVAAAILIPVIIKSKKK